MSTKNDPSTTDGGSGSDQIDSLTTGLKKLEKGPADLTLSAATRDQYLAILATYRDSLQKARDKMNDLETLGNVGTLSSAQQTKENLQNDVTGASGIQHIVTQYLDYLDEFERAIKSAADRLLSAG